MNDPQTIDNWDQHWDQYADSARHNPAQAYRRKIILKNLDLKSAPHPVRILDIGSGQGDFASDLKAIYPEARILGLELSSSGVEISKRKVPDACFIQHNLLELKEPPVEFSEWATHAVCSEVLEHVAEPEIILAHIRPYLAPGARLVFTVPGGPRSKFDIHIGHRKHYTRADFDRLLESSGYNVIRVSGAGFPFFNLYKLVVIARGNKLIQDVAQRQGHGTGMSVSARMVMHIFNWLFRFNLDHSGLGWQIVAIATKRG